MKLWQKQKVNGKILVVINIKGETPLKGLKMIDILKGLFLGACFVLPVVLWAFGFLG
jgi:hypothetical protein